MFAKPLSDPVRVAAGAEPEQLLVLCGQQFAALSSRPCAMSASAWRSRASMASYGRGNPLHACAARSNADAARAWSPAAAATAPAHGEGGARRRARYSRAVLWRTRRPALSRPSARLRRGTPRPGRERRRSPTPRCPFPDGANRLVGDLQCPADAVRPPQPGQRSGGLHRVVGCAEPGRLIEDEPEVLLRRAPASGRGCQAGDQPNPAEADRRPVRGRLRERRAPLRRPSHRPWGAARLACSSRTLCCNPGSPRPRRGAWPRRGVAPRRRTGPRSSRRSRHWRGCGPRRDARPRSPRRRAGRRRRPRPPPRRA